MTASQYERAALHKRPQLVTISQRRGAITPVGTCSQCGGPVYGRSDKAWCSKRCKQAAYRIRKSRQIVTIDDGDFLLSYCDVLALLGLQNRQALDRLRNRDGANFPHEIKLGVAKQSPVRFKASEIQAWIDNQRTRRDWQVENAS